MVCTKDLPPLFKLALLAKDPLLNDAAVKNFLFIFYSRKCGRIFCGACANQYMPLPDEQLYEPVRVCSQCFEQHYTT